MDSKFSQQEKISAHTAAVTTCSKNKTLSKQPFYVSTTLTICKIRHLKVSLNVSCKEKNGMLFCDDCLWTNDI